MITDKFFDMVMDELESVTDDVIEVETYNDERLEVRSYFERSVEDYLVGWGDGMAEFIDGTFEMYVAIDGESSLIWQCY